MPLVILRDGQTLELEGEDLTAALAAGGRIAGSAGRDEFGRETVEGLDKLSTVYEPVARSAAKRYESRMDSYEDENIQAFGEGLARGATAGLIYNDEEEQDRARANPYLSTGGELTGIVGGAALGVGAGGIAAKAGTMAAGRLGLSGVAGLAVEGAVDGMVYATMQQASEYIHNRPIDGEAILLAGLTGGAIGGAAGAVVKGLGKAREGVDSLSASLSGGRGLSSIDDAGESLVIKGKKGHWTDKIADEAMPDAEGFNPFRMATPDEVKAVRGFVSDMPEMKAANASARVQHDAIEIIDRELAEVGSENMVFIEDDILPRWNSLQTKRSEFGRELGWTPRPEKMFQHTGKTHNFRYDPPADFWQGVYVASPERRVRLLAKWEEIVKEADDIQASLSKLKHGDSAMRSDVWVYGPKSKPTANALRGITPDGWGGIRSDPAAAGVARSKWVQENIGTKATAYSDDIAEVMRHVDPNVQHTFKLSDATTPTDIMGALARGEDVTVGQFLSLSTAERRGALKSLSPEAKGRLGAMWKSDPELVAVKLDSAPVDKVDYSALRRELRQTMGEAEGDKLFERFAAETSTKKARPSVASHQPPTWKDDIANVLGTLARFKLGLPALSSIMGAGEKLLPYVAQAAQSVSKSRGNKAGRSLSLSGAIAALTNGPLRPDRFLAETNAVAGLQSNLAETLDVHGLPEGAQKQLQEQFMRQTAYLRTIAPLSIDPYEAVYPATQMRRWTEALECWRHPVEVLGRGATIVELQHIREMWPAIYREFYAGIESKGRVQVGTNKQILAIVNSNTAMRAADTQEGAKPEMKKPGQSQLSQKVISVLAPQSDSERMSGPK